jgi:hypothetical protein
MAGQGKGIRPQSPRRPQAGLIEGEESPTPHLRRQQSKEAEEARRPPDLGHGHRRSPDGIKPQTTGDKPRPTPTLYRNGAAAAPQPISIGNAGARGRRDKDKEERKRLALSAGLSELLALKSQKLQPRSGVDRLAPSSSSRRNFHHFLAPEFRIWFDSSSCGVKFFLHAKARARFVRFLQRL